MLHQEQNQSEIEQAQDYVNDPFDAQMQQRYYAYHNRIGELLPNYSLCEAVKLAFSQDNLLLRNRASRSEYLSFILAGVLYTIAYFLFALLILVSSFDNFLIEPFTFIWGIGWALYSVLLTCLTIRRGNDFGLPTLVSVLVMMGYWAFFYSIFYLILDYILPVMYPLSWFFEYLNDLVWNHFEIFFCFGVIQVCLYAAITGTNGPNNYGCDPIQERIYQRELRDHISKLKEQGLAVPEEMASQLRKIY